jgi:sugar O-acyltransferase (sialic acid O-acetyltransferase NeuD family)
VLVGIARRDGDHVLVGYVDVEDRGVRHRLSYLGSDDASSWRHPERKLLLGVGLMDDAMSRWRLYTEHRDRGMDFVTLVSARACIGPDVRLGGGTVVMDQAAVNAGTELGEACIVNTGAVVEHDCRIGNNVHVGPHATICGGVEIEDHCLIGAGATIVPGTRIAAGSLIGAGAVVASDLERPGTYVGVPAKRCGEGMA